MHKVTLKHYLEVYKTRLEMQQQGITNPPEHVKNFTKKIVEKLSQLSQEEIVEFIDMKLVDSNGYIIADFKNMIVF